jgi:hypothetical protein
MSEPMVTVMREAKVTGWPDEPGRTPRDMDRAYVLPLSKALTRSFTTDAHFAAYASPNGRRLRQAALDSIAVRIDLIVLDIDCKEAHGTGKPAPDDWRVEIRQKMLALLSAHKGAFYFETRGGSRIIYRQPVPVIIASAEDAYQWRQDYATTCAYLARVFDIEADPACSDWTRLFRLPRATRANSGAPEAWPTAGDPANVEPLWFLPSDEDTEQARLILPKAFDEHTAKRVLDIVPSNSNGDGYGLLYHALRNRGDLIRPFKSGFLIRCPNEAQHSGGKTGDTSTVLFLPGPGEKVGTVCCLHGHCADKKVRDWVRMFSREELDEAARNAGIADSDRIRRPA